MNIKKFIPNAITLANLLCGTLAVIFAVKGDFTATAFLVVLGIVFDFFDGFAARMLKVQGELGKQLDSLADMVTSGVVPGIVMMQLLAMALDKDPVGYFGVDPYGATGSNIPYLGLIITLGAGYRLAKFNIDERQSESFIGVPTPAVSLLVVSLPLILDYTELVSIRELLSNSYVLLFLTAILTYLMNAELPLFSLKFKSFDIKTNLVKYIFLVFSVVMLVLLKVAAVPVVILGYVLISLIQNTFAPKS